MSYPEACHGHAELLPQSTTPHAGSTVADLSEVSTSPRRETPWPICQSAFSSAWVPRPFHLEATPEAGLTPGSLLGSCSNFRRVQQNLIRTSVRHVAHLSLTPHRHDPGARASTG